MRGISRPLEVELISSIAELAGGTPVVLMLTWLSELKTGIKTINPTKKKNLTVVFMGNRCWLILKMCSALLQGLFMTIPI